MFSWLRREDNDLAIVMGSGLPAREVSSRRPGKRVDVFLAKTWTPQRLVEAVHADDG